MTTHDLPPTAGYLAGDHVRLRDVAGPADQVAGGGTGRRRRRTQRLAGGTPPARRAAAATVDAAQAALAPDAADATDAQVQATVHALHRYLTWTPSRLISVALSDLVGDRRTQNQPGTIDEYPNWRVPLAGPDGALLPLEDGHQPGAQRSRRWSTRADGASRCPRAGRHANATVRRADWRYRPVGGVLEEEPDHLGRCVGAERIGVAAGGIAAEPGVPAAVDDPGLGDDGAAGIGVRGPGVGRRRRFRRGSVVDATGADRRMPVLRPAGGDQPVGVGDGDHGVAVAVKDDQRCRAAGDLGPARGSSRRRPTSGRAAR